jgi:hypothetical protein
MNKTKEGIKPKAIKNSEVLRMSRDVSVPGVRRLQSLLSLRAKWVIVEMKVKKGTEARV